MVRGRTVLLLLYRRPSELYLGAYNSLSSAYSDYYSVELRPMCGIFRFQGGIYVVNLLDQFAATYSILIAVFFEAVAVSWIYGELDSSISPLNP